MDITFYRYANDPPSSQGERAIKIYYADGGYDLIGDIVDFFDSNGKEVPVRGWYYIGSEDIKYFFDKFCPDVVKQAD